MRYYSPCVGSRTFVPFRYNVLTTIFRFSGETCHTLAVSQHIDISKNTKAWAVSQHIDTSKNTKAWAVSQHIDISKNTEAWAVSQHTDTYKNKNTKARAATTH